MLKSLVWLVAMAAAGAAPIGIVINGDRLPLDPPPLVDHGVLFVPVRRTIEALGLPFSIEGKRIVTQVGSKNVSIVAGSRFAVIDGNSVALEAPAREYRDTLYAPLRFFTNVLGAQASFDTKARQVTIVSQLVGRTANGMSSQGAGYVRTGTVSAVDVLSDPPSITLTYPSGPKTIKIAANAIVDLQDVNANVTVPGELNDIRPGDFARVEMRKDGRVERIVDAFGSRNGRIVAVAGNQFVLDDGQVIAPGRLTEISINGKAASFADLAAGDSVTVRYNVESNEVRSILAGRVVTASPAPGSSPAITSLVTDATHPLRAGEPVTVTLHGAPQGAATFEVGSYVSNIPMHETAPGTYVGTYAIPRGANFDAVPVTAQLVLPGGVTSQAQASELLSASSTPPGVSDYAPDNGAVVNTSRPAIYATFAADAVAVNPSSALLWVNGRDVTSNCVRTAQFIQYLPSYSYPDGRVTVAVRVSDRAGNTTTKTWSFTIRTH